MVADTTPPTTTTTLPSNHQDKNLPNNSIVNVVADAATQIVADNMNAVISLSQNLNNLLQTTQTFNTKYDQLTQDRIYDNATKTGLEILDNSLVLKNHLDQISNVANHLMNVIKVSDLEQQLTQVSLLETEIKDLVNELDNIEKVAQYSEFVVQVANISEEIFKLRELEEVLVALHFNLDKLITIYNYLPQLLRLSEALERYLAFTKDNMLTDEQVYRMIDDLVSNLEHFVAIYNQLPDIIELANKIEKFPELIEKINIDLEELTLKYQKQLENYVNNLTDGYEKALLETRAKFQEMLEKQSNYVEECRKISMNLTSAQTEIEVAKLDLQKLKLETQSELKAKFQEIENKFLTLELEHINKVESLLTNSQTTLNRKYDEFHMKLQNLELQYQQKTDLMEKKLLIALDKLEKSTQEYESFKSEVTLMIKAEIGRMIHLDLNPYLNQGKYSKGDIINLIMQYAPSTKTLTEAEIKKLIADTITSQNLSRDEVIEWLHRLNEYREEKLEIEDFSELVRN